MDMCKNNVAILILTQEGICQRFVQSLYYKIEKLLHKVETIGRRRKGNCSLYNILISIAILLKYIRVNSLPGIFFLNRPQQNHQSYPLNADESNTPDLLVSDLWKGSVRGGSGFTLELGGGGFREGGCITTGHSPPENF